MSSGSQPPNQTVRLFFRATRASHPPSATRRRSYPLRQLYRSGLEKALPASLGGPFLKAGCAESPSAGDGIVQSITHSIFPKTTSPASPPPMAPAVTGGATDRGWICLLAWRNRVIGRRHESRPHIPGEPLPRQRIPCPLSRPAGRKLLHSCPPATFPSVLSDWSRRN
jgi:hypothetical protein